jgi:RecA-family ATPase
MQWRDGRDHGVFPRGKTGLLTATGGVGKTYAMTDLAVTVAEGGFWMATFRAVEAGHVLLALGEEDADEARRRVSRTLNARGLNRAQRDAIAEHLHVLPLHGTPIALTYSPAAGVVIESEFAEAFRDKLHGCGVDWSLIILDPLARWAAGGVETNNEAATRFVQVVETLSTVRGNPSVLLAHHSSQASAQSGKSDSRGVTAIDAGFRWRASLDAVADDDVDVEGIILRNPKSNYSLKFRPMLLMRNTEPGIEGTLRQATKEETARLEAVLPKERMSATERDEAKTTAKRTKFDAECDAVIACLPDAPGYVNRDELLGALAKMGRGCSHNTLETRIAALRKEGRMVDLSNGARSVPRQYAKPSVPPAETLAAE